LARYYHLAYDQQQSELSCTEDLERKQKAESLDGSYLLKSSRNDPHAEDIWRTYVLLRRVEAAFRAIKSPLCERPFFHFIIWSDESKRTSFCVCWPITYWSVLSAPSLTKASTPAGKPCAGNCPRTKRHPARYTTRANPPRHLPRAACARTHPFANQTMDPK